MTAPAAPRTIATTSGRFAAITGAFSFDDPEFDVPRAEHPAPIVADGTVGAARGSAASKVVADPVVLLYADFPGLGDRWENDADRTAAMVERAHAAFRQTVTAHGGELVPAPVDARCARFGSVAAAAVAGMAYRRAIQSRGELRVRLAITASPAPPDDGIPMAAFNRARLLAEGAHAGACVLDRTAAEGVTAELPAGARLRPTLRSLPELQQSERAMLLEDEIGADTASSRTVLPLAHALCRRGIGLSTRLRCRTCHG